MTPNEKTLSDNMHKALGVQQVEHTPGPWVASDGKWRSQILGIGYDKLIAEVFHVPEAPESRESSLEAYDAGHANARLIAAAPDLLAACKVALKVWQDDPRHPYGGIADMIQSAIAKAEGNL